MTTVVDELVVQFKLDPKQFTAGQKQVVSDIEKVEQQADKSGAKWKKAASAPRTSIRKSQKS